MVVLLGPTASGKTTLSLMLAEQFQGEIVNCDSVAVYRDFDVGTAKPSATQRTRVQHHMLDCIDPKSHYTAGDYSRDARRLLVEIRVRGHLPIVTGGTGLYLRALIDGLFPGPPRSEELRQRLRERADNRGAAYVHRILFHLDRTAAAAVHPNDISKVIRAIEVCLNSRQRMTDLWKIPREPVRGFRILRLGLNPDRGALYARINRRAQMMFEAGLIEETRSLMERYGPSAQPLNSLGYKQAVQVIGGETDAHSALVSAQQAHRNYAKRQMTWFRREPEVTWLPGFGDDPAVQNRALDLVRSALAA